MPPPHEALQPIHPSMANKLDPVFERLYNDHVAHTPPKPIDLATLREDYPHLYSYGTGPAPPVGRIYDAEIPLDDDADALLPVRVYEPPPDGDNAGPHPVHVDFHGGGWALGDLDTEAHLCRHICAKAKVVVIDVAYRLVPEHAFPVGITDGFAALRHIHRAAHRFNIRPDRISVGGVSAGGCIALALAHLARDHEPGPIPLRLVLAGTPVIDDVSRYARAGDSPFASARENEHAPALDWARLAWFDRWWGVLGVWWPGGDGAAARQRVGWFANLLAAPDYARLPRTVICTAGADPLRDEGERYARVLVENGVEVTLRRFPGVPHPFMHMDGHLWQARHFIDMAAREIRHALHDE